MSFWDSLKALFIFDAFKQNDRNSKNVPAHPHEQYYQLEAAADKAYSSKYETIEESIINGFFDILDNTIPNDTSIHEKKLYYIKYLTAMPLFIALDWDSLISYDGRNMFSGIEKIFDRPAGVYNFAGADVRKASDYESCYASKKAYEFKDKLDRIVGRDNLGILWYILLFLKPKTNTYDLRKAITELFHAVCLATDTIARMEANDYQYSSIPNQIKALSIEFEVLIEKSYLPDFYSYNNYDEDWGYQDFSYMVQMDASQRILNR